MFLMLRFYYDTENISIYHFSIPSAIKMNWKMTIIIENFHLKMFLINAQISIFNFSKCSDRHCPMS
jgi:hypothetical protein